MTASCDSASSHLQLHPGAAFLVTRPDGKLPDAKQVIGKSKCCWSRTPPILYAALPLQCATNLDGESGSTSPHISPYLPT